MSNLIHSDILTITLNPSQINEATGKHSGKFIVPNVVVQRANKKNANKRFYKKEVLEREADKYIEGPIKEKRAYGELDHSEETIVNLKNACINIMELWWEEDDLMAIIEVLNTPSGKIVQELLKAGLGVGISSRGTGSVTQIDEESVEVDDNFELICWDIVSNPSTPGAFLPTKSLNESIDSKQLEYNKINEVISDILCMNIGWCSCELHK